MIMNTNLFQRLIYRLYRWVWNPVFKREPRLMIPLACDLQSACLERLGEDACKQAHMLWYKIRYEFTLDPETLTTQQIYDILCVCADEMAERPDREDFWDYKQPEEGAGV